MVPREYGEARIHLIVQSHHCDCNRHREKQQEQQERQGEENPTKRSHCTNKTLEQSAIITVHNPRNNPSLQE